MTSVSNITNMTVFTHTGHGPAVTIDTSGNVIMNGQLSAAQNTAHTHMTTLGITGAQGAIGAVGQIGAVGSGVTGILSALAAPGYLNPYPLLKQMTWNFEPFETLIPVMDFDLTRQEIQIHLHAWKGSDGQDVLDQTVIVLPDNQPHLCFGSADSFNRFAAWRTRYQRLFGDQLITQHGLPSLVGGRRTLTFVALPTPSMPQDRLIEYLIWFSGHVRSPFYYAHGIFAFEDDADAFAFQMQFKGT